MEVIMTNRTPPNRHKSSTTSLLARTLEDYCSSQRVTIGQLARLTHYKNEAKALRKLASVRDGAMINETQLELLLPAFGTQQWAVKKIWEADQKLKEMEQARSKAEEDLFRYRETHQWRELFRRFREQMIAHPWPLMDIADLAHMSVLGSKLGIAGAGGRYVGLGQLAYLWHLSLMQGPCHCGGTFFIHRLQSAHRQASRQTVGFCNGCEKTQWSDIYKTYPMGLTLVIRQALHALTNQPWPPRLPSPCPRSPADTLSILEKIYGVDDPAARRRR
jgi:hypothetical protein